MTIGNNAVSGESGYGTPSALYQSGVGYDAATGLGSVNVANLVNSWGSIHFSTTTTTLQLNNGNPVHIMHGQSVPLSITVTSASGTPTGDVTLGGSNTGFLSDLVDFPLVNGAVNTTTNLLSGGSYLAIAEYGGDPNFAPSISQQFAQVTVDPEPTQTSIGLQAVGSGQIYNGTGAVPAGDYEWLVNVTTAAGTCTPGVGLPQCPSGRLYGFAGGYNDLPNQSSVALVQLDSFGNTKILIHLDEIGQHSLNAVYAGDINFATSQTTTPFNVVGIDLNMGNSLLYVGQGASSTINVNVFSAGFNGPVTFDGSSCSGLPALATCSFKPASVTGDGQTVLTITTTAPALTVTGRPGKLTWPGEALWSAITIALLLLSLLLVGAGRGRLPRFAARLAFTCLLVALAGCGGGGSNAPSSPGTPAGAYTITVSASAGGFSAKTSFTLNVQ